MRRFVVLSLVSLLGLPGLAAAQDSASQPAYQSPPSYAPPPDDQGAGGSPSYAPPATAGGAPQVYAPPPYGPPDGAAPDGAPPDGGQPGEAPPGGKEGHMAKMQAAFAAANTTHDGRLTLAQAQAAGLKPVVRHFAEIDSQNRGYVTMGDVQAWRMEQQAKKMEQKAAQLRAQN